MSDETTPPSAERRRIIAEEEFRKATARRLDSELASFRQRTFQTLNSPVGIWFLSTVIVGLASVAYQEYNIKRQQEAQQHALVVPTTNEMLYRLGACDGIHPNSDRNNVENLLSSVIGLRPLSQEFKNRNLADVYSQFCSLTGKCKFMPDSLAAIAEDIRRTTWPVIVGQPIDRPLKDRSILPKLEASCAGLGPVRAAIRASLSD